MNKHLKVALDDILVKKYDFRNIIEYLDNFFIKKEFWDRIDEFYNMYNFTEEDYKKRSEILLENLLNEVTESEITINSDLHIIVRRTIQFRLFRKFYNKVFKINENLYEMLKNTDVNNINSNYIRLPFSKILLILPEEIVIENNAYKNILVSEIKDSLPLEYRDIYLSKPNKLLYFAMAHELRDYFFEFYLYLWDELSIEECLKRSLDIYNDNQTEIKEGYYILINFILYLIYIKDYRENNNYSTLKKIASNKKSTNKKRQVENKIMRECFIPCDYFEVGEKIIIGKTEEESKHIFKIIREKQHINKSFWVRGHWREYKHERYKMENKLQWIEPFLKGVDIKNFTNKIYEVK